MTNEITETMIIDFCNDLEQLFTEHNMCIYFNKNGKYNTGVINQYVVKDMIQNIQNNYYNG